MIATKIIACGTDPLIEPILHRLSGITYRHDPLFLLEDYRHLWDQATGSVAPHRSRRKHLDFSEKEYLDCLSGYPDLLCHVTRPRGKSTIKFRPEVTRTVIEETLAGIPAQLRRLHPLMKAWKNFFVSSEPYHIAQVSIKRMLKDGLQEVPSFILETIRYNPSHSGMLGNCSYMEEVLPILGEIGGDNLSLFLKDIQSYRVVNRRRDPYIPLVIKEILIAMLRNGVPLIKGSLLHKRVNSLIAKKVGFEYQNVGNSPVQSVTFEDLARFLSNTRRNSSDVREFLHIIDLIREQEVTPSIIGGIPA